MESAGPGAEKLGPAPTAGTCWLLASLGRTLAIRARQGLYLQMSFPTRKVDKYRRRLRRAKNAHREGAPEQEFSGFSFSSSTRPLTGPVPLSLAKARPEAWPQHSFAASACLCLIRCSDVLLTSTRILSLSLSFLSAITELFAHLPAGMIDAKSSFPERNF